jgi:WD40 repeat protein
MQTDSDQNSVIPAARQAPPRGQRGHWSCQCGKTLRFDYHRAGKLGRCPACGRRFTIPQAAPVEGAELTFRGHSGPIRAVAFSPDARLLATAADIESPQASKSELAETILWDTATGFPVRVLHWHRKPVTVLAFSPDGRWLATGSKDQTISIWDVERGLWDAVMAVHEHVLRGHEAPLTALAFAPDGAWLASAAADGTIRLWNTASWQPLRTIDTGRSGEGSLAVSPCGRSVAAAWTSRGPVTLWKTASGEQQLELRLWSTEDTEDYGVGFSSDGARLAVLGDQQVRIWELSTCQVVSTLDAPGSRAIAAAPRANVVATGGLDPATGANVTLWDTASLTGLREFDGHTQSVSAIAFSADGKLLASGGRDGIANLWLLR